jgi:hypothetical protein
MPIERRIVTLDTTGHAYAESRASGEIRVLLYGPGAHTLWGFAPHPACNGRTPGYLRAQMGNARQRIQGASCSTVTVTGVLFFSSRPEKALFRGDDRVQLRPILGFTTHCD